MKKFVQITFISLGLMSMSSCFLFQTHEDCPAYGDVKVKKENTKTEQIVSTIEQV